MASTVTVLFYADQKNYCMHIVQSLVDLWCFDSKYT